jgi:hypothetical protein
MTICAAHIAVNGMAVRVRQSPGQRVDDGRHWHSERGTPPLRKETVLLPGVLTDLANASAIITAAWGDGYVG